MRTKTGVITSAKMTGTITVTVHHNVVHPLYKKHFRSSKKFLADVGDFKDLQEGDTVLITECRPLSKRKHFRLTEVITRTPRVSEMKEEAGLESMMQSKKNTEDSEESSSPSAK